MPRSSPPGSTCTWAMTGWPLSTARPRRLSAPSCCRAASPRVPGERAAAAAVLGPAGRQDPGHHRADAPLPGADRLRAAAGQRGEHRPDVAVLCRIPGRGRPRPHRPGPDHPRACRGVQALAGGPARAEQAGRDPGHDRAPARHAADVLHPYRRMGLGRRTGPGADVPGDLPRLDRPLPKALDDAAAARLLRAAQQDRRMLVRVTVEMLLRTGLRVSEYTGLPAGAMVLIGAGPWLHVPVGKLGEDRYLPLHPQLVTLIDAYRAAHVPPGHPLLLPRENGRALDRHTVTRMINRAGAAAGLGHIHPHQLRHTLATQAINRGMSLEAIAALLGHRSLDMTLRYAKIASRTVADEYFAVTEKVEALYGQPAQLPADAIGPQMTRLR